MATTAKRLAPAGAPAVYRGPAQRLRLHLPHARAAGESPGPDDGQPGQAWHDARAGTLPARHADGARWLRERPLGLRVLPEDETAPQPAPRPRDCVFQERPGR